MRREETAIILAGGKGERMQSIIPKQFLELDGEPVLMHTLRRFYEYSPQMKLILVLPSEQMAMWKNLCERHAFALPHETVRGGSARFFSVKNGLDKVDSRDGVIAVHDGVRPLINIETIARCFDTALRCGSAIPVINLTDSIRRVSDDGSVAVNRSDFKLVQTPQVFRADILLRSYDRPFSELFTDDASVVEAAGYTIHLVEGNKHNMKITHPQDMGIAEILMKMHHAKQQTDTKQ